ncbi:MAG: hypothetical protein IJX78_00855 [Bacilli bacterium]|nr:hypothetical protein [Bacilli bacterium]
MKKYLLILVLMCLCMLTSCCNYPDNSTDKPEDNVNCEKNPEHESCLEEPIDDTNKKYTEITVDEKIFFDSYEHTWIRNNPLYGVFQFGFTKMVSLPEIMFSEISDKYIAIYVDNAYMEVLNYEFSKEREEEYKNAIDKQDDKWNFYLALKNCRKAFEDSMWYYKDDEFIAETNITYGEAKDAYLVPTYGYQLYYDIISNDENKMYTYKGLEINRDNFGVTYYEVDKSQEILLKKDNKTLIGLYGTREITCVYDYYDETNIGNAQTVYFSIPIFIKNNKVIAEEKVDYFSIISKDEYNSLWRTVKTNTKYLYSYWGSMAYKNLGKLVQPSCNLNEYYLMEVREIDGKDYLITNGSINDYLNQIAAGPKPKGFDEKIKEINDVELSLKTYYNDRILKKWRNSSEEWIESEWEAYLLSSEKKGRSLEVYLYDEIVKMIEEYDKK